MLYESRTMIRVEKRVSVGGAETARAARDGDLATFLRRGLWGRGPWRSRRMGLMVEAIEPRIALSGLTSQALGSIRGVEDPNLRRAASIAGYTNPNQRQGAAVHGFNTQPDPP